MTQINAMAQPSGKTKIINLQRDSDGQITEITEKSIVHNAAQIDYPFLQEMVMIKGADGRAYRIPLYEALVLPDAGNIFRTDVRKVAFDAFNANQRSFGGFTSFMDSNMPQEEYLRDAAIGVIPKAPSGTPAPDLISDFEGGTIIVNDLYRGKVKILREWIRFDKINKIAQISAEMGLSGRMTEENAVYSFITSTGKYNRGSATGDNDVGANQRTLTWNADSLRDALATIATSKDRKSGAYLGYNADTIIIGPRLQVPVMQLLRTVQLSRTHGATTAEAIGTGAVNVLAGALSTIIVSPWFDSSFGWAICDSTRNTFKFQTVEGFTVQQQTPNLTSESILTFDVLEYLVLGYFGVGFVDDRAWFYSDSTTDATVS